MQKLQEDQLAYRLNIDGVPADRANNIAIFRERQFVYFC